VRGLVELHGGSIAAASPGEGLGSSFTVRLPLAREGHGSAFDARPAPGDEVKRRVLVVEDNGDHRELLRTLLGANGHEVEVAADGHAGVTHALAFRPEVMLVDIGLPGLDGYEVARRVRAALGRRVALVAVTGYGSSDVRRRALDAGFDEHLTKPVDVDTLRRTIRKVAARAAS
jgi:CheY-like chemotaxis protein